MNENRLQRSTLRENESRAGQIPGLACSSGTVRNPQPTYEYTMREDIVMCMEELELEPEKARALLRSPCPLCVVYKEFRDRETEQMPCSTWTKRRMRSWTASEARRSRRKRPWQESVKKAKSQRQCRTSALPL